MAKAIAVRVGELDLLLETRVVTQAGSQDTSAVGKAVAATVDAFGRAQQAIEEIAVATANTIARTAKRVAAPSQVQVEFGISVGAEGTIIIAGVAAQASLKVTLTYQTTSPRNDGSTRPALEAAAEVADAEPQP